MCLIRRNFHLVAEAKVLVPVGIEREEFLVDLLNSAVEADFVATGGYFDLPLGDEDGAAFEVVESSAEDLGRLVYASSMSGMDGGDAYRGAQSTGGKE